MHPEEFWWLVEANQPPKMYGTMTEDEVAELYEWKYGTNEHRRPANRSDA